MSRSFITLLSLWEDTSRLSSLQTLNHMYIYNRYYTGQSISSIVNEYEEKCKILKHNKISVNGLL